MRDFQRNHDWKAGRIGEKNGLFPVLLKCQMSKFGDAMYIDHIMNESLSFTSSLEDVFLTVSAADLSHSEIVSEPIRR